MFEFDFSDTTSYYRLTMLIFAIISLFSGILRKFGVLFKILTSFTKIALISMIILGFFYPSYYRKCD